MKKLAYAAASLAFCGIAAAIVIPNFLNFRLKAKSSESRSNLGAGRGTEVAHTSAPLTDSEVAAPAAPPPRMAVQAPSPRVDFSKQVTAYTGEQGAPPLSQEYVGRDRFEKITPNPVKVTAAEPVSTFSIDVDTASYAFARRALKAGHLPQKNAVRIEEMINYFDYDYPRPSDRSAPFRSTVTVFPTPWNPGTKLMHIGIKGLALTLSEKPRANLVFLLDVSGSMNRPDKLPLLKNSFRMLVETLDPEDTVAIVVYAGAAGTILEPTKASERGRILAALERLQAGGSTAGGAGIRRAYALAEESFDREGVNRVILATDGDFNVGIRNPEELKNFVERKRKTGVYLSVLGFGQGNLNDELMQKLAQNGNGNAAYIDTLSEARKVLVDEAGGTLFTIAKDVKIQVEFNPAVVAEYRLIGYETRLLRREDFRNDKVDAGDVGSGHTVTAIYEVTPVGSAARMIDDLRYGGKEAVDGEEGGAGEYAFLKIRYKLPDESKSRLMTTPVSREMEFDSIDGAPDEARFAAAVAAFGQLLREDPYTKDFSWDDVIDLARSARGEDPFGYRSEFLSLVRLAESARAMGDR
jgi:Ca-activated chloride channel family protein